MYLDYILALIDICGLVLATLGAVIATVVIITLTFYIFLVALKLLTKFLEFIHKSINR